MGKISNISQIISRAKRNSGKVENAGQQNYAVQIDSIGLVLKNARQNS